MPSSPLPAGERRRRGLHRARALTLAVAGGSLVAAGAIADIAAQSATHRTVATGTSSTGSSTSSTTTSSATATGSTSSSYSAPTASSSSAQVSSGSS